MCIITAIMLLFSSCSFYRENFTKYDNGVPNHTVQVTYCTFLMIGEAARLKTTTQTEDFIREVNTEGASSKPDNATISAITEGVVNALTKP